MVWRDNCDSLIFKITKLLPKSKLAMFDLDSTLILPTGFGNSARNKDEYILFNDKVIEKIRELHKKRFTIIIFSNQNSIKSALQGKAATSKKELIDDLLKKIKVPVNVFMATKKDNFRKPEKGMFDFYVENFSENVKVNLKGSFFVGDALGREGDFSDSDKLFAKNIGVKYFSPEEFFI